MTKIDINNLDYNQLGFMCGIEIHQQLNTSKLFCNCPSKLINDDTKPNKIIERRLRAVSSETGDFDLTAKEEQDKKKIFKYFFYNECNCLVETDSQPPFNINQNALDIAIMISLLTNSSMVNESHVMRKQVVDGSNVSGFQRTAMISTNGFLDFSFGRVRIDKILLEEDAARALERSEHQVTYSLDRLGIPLIEMVVWHDMKNPSQAKEVALFIGQLFRSTGKTKRGLGSIRQDINVSIKDGSRVEIKGCQDLNLIPEIIDREIVRQLNLIDIKNVLLEKNMPLFSLKEFEINFIFNNSESKIVNSSLKENKNAYLFILPNFKGFLGREIQPNRRLGSEIANVLKIRTTLKGLFHLDELPNYGITNENIDDIKSKFSLNENDSFIIVFSLKDEIDSVRLVLESRLNSLFDGVLKETRAATLEGNTEYQRPLSTSSRMYPETDLLPIVFTKEIIENSRKKLPLPINERKKLYLENFCLNPQLVEKMVLNNFAPVFEKIVLEHKINPTSLAVFLLEDLIKASRDSNLDLNEISEDLLIDFFSQANVFEVIPKNKIIDVFIEYLREPYNLVKIIKDNEKSIVSDLVIKDIILKLIIDNKSFVLKQKERAVGFLMGKAMSETNNQFDGRVISSIVKEELDLFLKKNSF